MSSSIESAPASPVVYIVTQQPFDYTPATQYGTLYFLEPLKLAPASPNDDGGWNKRLMVKLRNQLQDYRPGEDFIVPTGQPTMLTLVGMVLAQMGNFHKFLGWDSRAQRYHVYEVEL